MALTPLHVQDFCKGGTTCRFLCWETVNGVSTPLCLKQAPSLYQQVKYDMQLYGVDIDKRSVNCQGYLFLKHKEQGYDVK